MVVYIGTGTKGNSLHKHSEVLPIDAICQPLFLLYFITIINMGLIHKDKQQPML